MSREAFGSAHMTQGGEDTGVITHLTVRSSRPPRVAVFLDDALACEVSEEVVQAWGLRVGRTLSPAEQASLAIAEQILAAQTMALRYLGVRPRSAQEVRRKLARSQVPEAVVDHVMTGLQASGALDDAAYTQAYLATRLSGRGYGPQRLQRELHQRGISRDLVEEAIQHDLAAEDVLAAARLQAAKRWPRLSREADPARGRQKLYDFLRRRGFASAIVQQVLTEIAQDTASS